MADSIYKYINSLPDKRTAKALHTVFSRYFPAATENLTTPADLGALTATELAFLDGITAGTAAASKAVVLDSSSAVDIIKFGAIGASDSSLGIDGQAAAQGGAVVVTGGASSTATNAGGAVTTKGGAGSTSGAGGEAFVTGGVPGVTGVGGAATVAAGAGGATSGAGGVASLTGGAGTAGNSAGGVGKTVGGAGQGSAAGGKGQLTGGAGGATGVGGAVEVTGGAGGATSGAGGDVSVTGGAGTAGDGSGGSVVLAGGAKNGSGLDGGVFNRGTFQFRKMPAPQTATDTASLTDAQMVGGVLVATPTAAAAYTVRTGTQLKAALPADLSADDAFDLTIINLGGTGDDITLTAATDITIVGDPVVGPVADVATEQMSTGTFRFRFVSGTTFVAYRVY